MTLKLITDQRIVFQVSRPQHVVHVVPVGNEVPVAHDVHGVPVVKGVPVVHDVHGVPVTRSESCQCALVGVADWTELLNKADLGWGVLEPLTNYRKRQGHSETDRQCNTEQDNKNCPVLFPPPRNPILEGVEGDAMSCVRTVQHTGIKSVYATLQHWNVVKREDYGS